MQKSCQAGLDTANFTMVKLAPGVVFVPHRARLNYCSDFVNVLAAPGFKFWNPAIAGQAQHQKKDSKVSHTKSLLELTPSRQSITAACC